MKKQAHLLSGLWESYPDIVADHFVSPTGIQIGQYLSEMLAMGPFYYYVINFVDYSIFHIHENLLHMHGTATYPTSLHQVMAYIHPEDLEFVMAAEKATILKMQEIGFEHKLLLKNSYCFRMKVANGSYHLFHHQAILLDIDDKGGLCSSLNIHTDINHITQVNNKIVLINGIGGRSDYCQMDLSPKSANIAVPKLSKREMEILNLLAQGLSSQEIGDKLFISKLTVGVHRKNLLKKTGASTSAYLIKTCIELGLI